MGILNSHRHLLDQREIPMARHHLLSSQVRHILPKILRAEEFWGEYDAPGWTANGVAPWGFHADPIGADGNLFLKGWLNLTQSMHTYVSGYDKWSSPFSVAGAYNSRFEWTQHQLADHLHQQWAKTPMGPHCENTKACLLYTSPSPRDATLSRMPSSA